MYKFIKHFFPVLSLLLPLSASAQTILKRAYFSMHALGVCTDTTKIAHISLDAAQSQIKVYSWTGLNGEVTQKSAPGSPKPPKEKFKMSSLKPLVTSSASTTSNVPQPPPPSPYDAGCLVERLLPFAYIMGSSDDPGDIKSARKFYGDKIVVPYDQMKHSVVYPKPKQAQLTYAYKPEYDKCGVQQLRIDTIGLIDPAELGRKFPLLSFGQTKQNFRIFSKGEGITQTKNLKFFVEVENSYIGVDSYQVALKYVKEPIQRIEVESVNSRLSEFMEIDGFPTFPLDSVTKFVILYENLKSERKTRLADFRLLKYNNKGEILADQIIKLEYLKSLRNVLYSYDEDGKPKGLVLIFASTLVIGSKSFKDPKENNNIVYYFDLDGKERFHCSMEYANRSLEPSIVVESKGKLRMMNISYEKMLKPKNEIIVLDETGLVGVEPATFDDIYSFGGAIQPIEKGVFMVTSAYPTKGDKRGRISITVINTKFELIGDLNWESPSNYQPTVTYIGKFGENYKFITSNGVTRNHFVSIGPDKRNLQFPAENEALRIPHKVLYNNYIVDRSTNKLYAFYEHISGNGLGYVVVIGL